MGCQHMLLRLGVARAVAAAGHCAAGGLRAAVGAIRAFLGDEGDVLARFVPQECLPQLDDALVHRHLLSVERGAGGREQRHEFTEEAKLVTPLAERRIVEVFVAYLLHEMISIVAHLRHESGGGRHCRPVLESKLHCDLLHLRALRIVKTMAVITCVVVDGQGHLGGFDER